MSQTDVVAGMPGPLPPPPDVKFPPGMPMPPGVVLPDVPPASAPALTTEQVGAEIAKATTSEPPTLRELDSTMVELPAGWLRTDGRLITTALVRELNGYDEERLARFDITKNGAAYVTELLALGVEDLGGEKPSKDTLRMLLIGDRDALVLGVRRATYGNDLEFKLSCTICEKESLVTIDLEDDIKVTRLEEPLVRTFDVVLRHGTATVALLNGAAQEAFSEGIGKKTSAEVNTVMLANSVVEINGVSVRGREARREGTWCG